MRVIKAINVNDAYTQGVALLRDFDTLKETSRVGDVYVSPDPVTTVYEKPRQRVLWDETRDANPFFHLLESLWMLAGRRDVKPMSDLVGRMADFSDDTVNFHAAYGYRWRSHFGRDQIEEVINQLMYSPGSRRVVMQMWDMSSDLFPPVAGAKDLPCNLIIHFQIRNNHLDMSVFNRSNDIIMGAYGANVVHMSVLQEYIANRLGRGVGRYWQISDNFHAYTRDYDVKCGPSWQEKDKSVDLYWDHKAVPWPTIVNEWPFFIPECNEILNDGPVAPKWRNSFLGEVAWPMSKAYRHHKAGDTEAGLSVLNTCFSGIDWIINGKQWLNRRLEAKKAKQVSP